MRFPIVFLFMFCGLLLSCNGGMKRSFATANDIIYQESSTANKSQKERFKRGRCSDALAYAPDPENMDHFPLRWIRVNFHFMNSEDGTRNYSEQKSREVVKKFIYQMNKKIATNKKMNLPKGNNTPVVPVNFRYILTPANPKNPQDDGIYHHYDDELYFFVKNGKQRNNYNRDVIKKYAIKDDSILNVFMMPHHPDSIISKSYKNTRNGIALGTSVKIAGMFELNEPAYKYAGMFNHEVGHVYSLRHTWSYDDGCDDTPKHPNCWNYTKDGPCKTEVSNNYMDSNAFQEAMTPCQIGKMHALMSSLKSNKRKLLVPNWCKLNPEKTVVIQKDFVWEGAKDLEGHLIIKSGASLTLKCRLSLPQNAVVTVEAGAQLILDNGYIHNSCGGRWKGIEILKSGSQKGEVIFRGEDARIENAINWSE